MRKDMIRAIAALVILVAVYTMLVLAIPFANVVQTKIGFGFTIIAFAVGILAVDIAFIRKPSAKSRFYRFPVAKLGLVYVLVQILLSIISMALGRWIPWWCSVAVYTLLLAGTLLGLISTEAVIAEIREQDKKLKKDVVLIRTLQSKTNHMANLCENSDAAAALKAFAEELLYSDPVSSDTIRDIEADLSAIVDALQQAVADGDSNDIKQLCRKATALLTERNRLCKLNKGDDTVSVHQKPIKAEHNQDKLLPAAYGFLVVILIVFWGAITLQTSYDEKKETERLEATVVNIQTAFDDGDFAQALKDTTALVYRGTYINTELEQKWEETQAHWVDQIKETERLTAINTEIQKAVNDGEYQQALIIADTLVYNGTYPNAELEEAWEEKQAHWVDQIKETERLTAINAEIQKAVNDGEYQQALIIADTLVYNGTYPHAELEEAWEEKRAHWVDQIKETERLTAITADIQEAVNDKDFQQALALTDMLVYKGVYPNTELEEKWDKTQTIWVDKVMTAAAKENVVLQ